MRQLRSHLTYANVTATIALFIALGGTGAWATHEVILSSDIVDGEVRNRDLADLGVSNAKLANHAVTSGKVLNGSLMGADVDSSACNVSTGSVQNTGANAGCISNHGVNDMVGNLAEWVADWVPASTNAPGWGTFSDDIMALAGASTSVQGPGAVFRGSYYQGNNAAGPFAVNATFQPSSANPTVDVGFRGAR